MRQSQMGGAFHFALCLFVLVALSTTLLPEFASAKPVKNAAVDDPAVASVLQKDQGAQEYGAAEFQDLAEAIAEGKEPIRPVEAPLEEDGGGGVSRLGKLAGRGAAATGATAANAASKAPLTSTEAGTAAGTPAEDDLASGTTVATSVPPPAAATGVAEIVADAAAVANGTIVGTAATEVAASPQKKPAKKKKGKKPKAKKPKWKGKPKAAPVATSPPAAAAADDAATAAGTTADETATGATAVTVATPAVAGTPAAVDDAPNGTGRATATGSKLSVGGNVLSAERFVMAPPASDDELTALPPLLKTATKRAANALGNAAVDRDFPTADGKPASAAKLVTGLDAAGEAEEGDLDGAKGEETPGSAVGKAKGAAGKGAIADADEPGQDSAGDTSEGEETVGTAAAKGKSGGVKTATPTEDSTEGEAATAVKPLEGDEAEDTALPAKQLPKAKSRLGEKATIDTEEGDEEEATVKKAGGVTKRVQPTSDEEATEEASPVVKGAKLGKRAAAAAAALAAAADTSPEDEEAEAGAAAGSAKTAAAETDEAEAEETGLTATATGPKKGKGAAEVPVEGEEETEPSEALRPVKKGAGIGKIAKAAPIVTPGGEEEEVEEGPAATKGLRGRSKAAEGSAVEETDEATADKPSPKGSEEAVKTAGEEDEEEGAPATGGRAGQVAKAAEAEEEATMDTVSKTVGVVGKKKLGGAESEEGDGGETKPVAEGEEEEGIPPLLSKAKAGSATKGKTATATTVAPGDGEETEPAAEGEEEAGGTGPAVKKGKTGALGKTPVADEEDGAPAGIGSPSGTSGTAGTGAKGSTAEGEEEEGGIAPLLTKAKAGSATKGKTATATTEAPDDDATPAATAAETGEEAATTEGEAEEEASALSGKKSTASKASPTDTTDAEKEGGEEGALVKTKTAVAGKMPAKTDEGERETEAGKGAEAGVVSPELGGGKGGEATTPPLGNGLAAGVKPPVAAFPLQDVSPSGNCSSEVERFCQKVVPGGANILDCLSKKVLAESADKPEVSAWCKSEIRAFKILMYTDITMDTKMQVACSADVGKFCDNDILYPEPGSVLACLREVKGKEALSDLCQVEVFRAQKDAAEDLAMDVQLAELCQVDAAKLCKGVPEGEGRVHECLRGQREKLGWDCQAELFRQEVENADDIRLNVRLFKACLADKRKFCADVIPGDARVKDCLEDHHEDPEFTPGCREEFTKMMARRAQDFRLDSNLRKFCKKDIDEICYPDAEDASEIANKDAKVIQCLQDFRDELKGPACRAEVHKLTTRAAEDIRFDKPLADACQGDRKTLCGEVPDGGGLVFKCLEEKRESLQEACRTALFGQEIRAAHDIDFKYVLKKACKAERKRFCSHVPSGHADVIPCLVRKLDDPDMGEECRNELKSEERQASTDYRLNFKLSKACAADMATLCAGVCPNANECGGEGLKCLAENQEAIQSDACKKEVFAFEKQMVADVQMDVPLQKACKADLEKFCPKVSKDHSRTLACLRSHREDITGPCKEEEMRFSIMEASDIRLTPTLMNACGQELARFCRTVPPSEGRAFKCLQAKLEDVGMGSICWAEVNLQEARHSSNYRLDVRVRNECEADVTEHCAGVDKGQEGHALVLKCLVEKFKKLSASCQTEVSYSVRMALWQYTKGADLTQPCDEMVTTKCPAVDDSSMTTAAEGEDAAASSEGGEAVGAGKARNSASSPTVVGVYGQCLMQAAWKDLSPECKKLVRVASKEGAHVGGKHDEEKLQETLQKLAALQVPDILPEESASSGLLLSSWLAVTAVAAVLTAILICGCYIYFRFCRRYRPYTLIRPREGP